jgi:hypothetical protein
MLRLASTSRFISIPLLAEHLGFRTVEDSLSLARPPADAEPTDFVLLALPLDHAERGVGEMLVEQGVGSGELLCGALAFADVANDRLHGYVAVEADPDPADLDVHGAAVEPDQSLLGPGSGSLGLDPTGWSFESRMGGGFGQELL